MKKNKLDVQKLFFLLSISCLNSVCAFANTNFRLTITNGGAMPISPGVVYAANGNRSAAEIGETPTPGLIQLCQTGNPTMRLQELMANSRVPMAMVSGGPILPGQSISLNVNVPVGAMNSLHFEGMYGKTKEICAAIHVDHKALESLDGFFTPTREILGNDQVIVAGAFTMPLAPSNGATACEGATSAVECLRSLSQPVNSNLKIHAFLGYLPSLLNYLEEKFGAEDTQTLLVSPSGALRYSLQK